MISINDKNQRYKSTIPDTYVHTVTREKRPN